MRTVRLLVSLVVPASLVVPEGDASLVCVLGDAQAEPLQIPVLQCWDAALRDTKRWRAVWRGRWCGARSAGVALTACSVPLLLPAASLACATTSTCASVLCRLFAGVVGMCIALTAWWFLLHLAMRTRAISTVLFAVHNECAFGIRRDHFAWHALQPPVPVRYLEAANSTQWISRLMVRDSARQQLALAVVHLPLAAYMWETVACRTLSALPPDGGVIVMTNPHGLDLHEYICSFARSGIRAIPAMGTYLLLVFSDRRATDIQVHHDIERRALCVQWKQWDVPQQPQEEGWGCS